MDRRRRRDKSPLHPSALTLNGVQPGVTYVRFDVEEGVGETGRFLSKAFVAETSLGKRLMATVSCSSGTKTVFLSDYGIVPISGRYRHFHPGIFTVKLQKQHLLPAPRPQDPRMYNTYMCGLNDHFHVCSKGY